MTTAALVMLVCLTVRIGAEAQDAYDKGAALLAAGRFQEARAVIEPAARLDPLDGSLTAALAMIVDVDSARVPRDAVQRIFRALDHGSAGRWKEAHGDIDEAVRLAPRYALAHATRAALHVSQGQYPAAIESLDVALSLDPQSAEIYYNRGAVRAEQQQFDAAIADYNRALALNPKLWEAYRNRGAAYTHQNAPEAAIADLTKAHQLRPRDGDVLLLRGEIHFLTKQWDAAIADFDKVVAVAPDITVARFNKAAALDNAGRVPAALAAYREFLEKAGPDDKQNAAVARQRIAALER